ncbi:hypothetical protein SNE40_006979 [Patella caerulea]|uniref:Uncharacterized protein n=1 Tax=Patella caerulea TaxID=87958 RepID=A0AAN8K2L6_PATCE
MGQTQSNNKDVFLPLLPKSSAVSTDCRQLLQEVRICADDLRKCRNDPVSGYYQLHRVWKLYYDEKTRCYRREIGKVLSECCFSAYVVSMLKRLLLDGYHPGSICGLLTNPWLWATSRLVLDIAWNYSDASDDFACDLANDNILEVLYKNLELYQNGSSARSGYRHFIIRATLSIITNISRRPVNKPEFLKFDFVHILLRFKSASDESIKVLALTALAFIKDPRDNHLLDDDFNAIPVIIRWLDSSLERDAYHRIKEGFTAAELAYVLNKLAVGQNVTKIIEEGGLEILRKMLMSSDIQQQINASQCLWSMAFNNEARKFIKANEELVEAVQELQQSKMNRQMLQNVNGLLWMLFDKDED